jgi:uncharacterized protein with von Willebrand factor type A (vWA) domain
MEQTKTQTSIDWLFENMRNMGIQVPADKVIDMIELMNQANEMDKEQKRNMFDCGRQYQLTGEGTFKEAYEEMYGTQNTKQEDIKGDVIEYMIEDVEEDVIEDEIMFQLVTKGYVNKDVIEDVIEDVIRRRK